MEQETELDELVEEAISKKKNVKDILVEMKDTSELMVDLAYSALLTNSKEIAEEVRDLEGYMDDLQYEIGAMLLLAARSPEDVADLAGILRVANSAEDIADAAENIVDIVIRGVGDHPIYKSFLEETEERIARIKVSEQSDIIGKTIGGYRFLTETGCYIRAIRRGNKWIYSPKKDTMINVGDVLILLGSKASLEKTTKICCKTA
jgi:uncharacterized protein with PhoU and TrkA domain